MNNEKPVTIVRTRYGQSHTIMRLSDQARATRLARRMNVVAIQFHTGCTYRVEVARP